MKKKIVIHIEDLTAAHEVLLQDLLQIFYVEPIEMHEGRYRFLLLHIICFNIKRSCEFYPVLLSFLPNSPHNRSYNIHNG